MIISSATWKFNETPVPYMTTILTISVHVAVITSHKEKSSAAFVIADDNELFTKSQLSISYVGEKFTSDRGEYINLMALRNAFIPQKIPRKQ